MAELFARLRALGACLCGLTVAGCAAPLPPASGAVAGPAVRAAAPERWQAPVPAALQAGADSPPLPHGGSLEELLRWWRAQGDPLLVELIEAAQRVSPSVAAAFSRLAQAQAARTGADAALAPSLDATASATRSRNLQFPGVAPMPITSGRVGLQSSWEIDLFGAGRAASEAAGQRLRGAQADWHEARVSVAAEVALQYDTLRQCRRLADISTRDARSRAETARLVGLSAQAGLSAPAELALVRAGAADAASRALAQQAQCEQDLKALVALTAWPEPQLRQRLAQASGPLRLQLPGLSLTPVPAQALAQRPDIYAAERAVLAARADVLGTEAQRLPRLSLTGSVGGAALSAGGSTVQSRTWAFGPLALSLPLLDGGRLRAELAAARARHDEAVLQYQARVRQAVQEVEVALVSLASTAERGPQVEAAAAGFRDVLAATEARQRAGLASLVELEDARRQQLASEIALADWQTQVRAAQVSLYRAVGGGWSPALLDAAAAPDVKNPR